MEVSKSDSISEHIQRKKGKMYEVEFNEKPSALELGTKIMEMFEFKEKYDGDFE